MATPGANAARAVEHKVETEEEVVEEGTTTSGDGGFKMPSLEAVRGGVEALDEMGEERTQRIYEAAEGINLKDRLEAISYGLDVQE